MCQGTNGNFSMKFTHESSILWYPVALKSVFTLNVSCNYITTRVYICMYVHIYINYILVFMYMDMYVTMYVCIVGAQYLHCVFVVFLVPVPIDTYIVLCSFTVEAQ